MDDTIETSTKTAEPPQPSASETIESMSAVARDGVTKARDQILSRSAGVRDELASAATSAKDQIDAMAEPLKQKAHSIADDHKVAGAARATSSGRHCSLRQAGVDLSYEN